MLNNKFLTWPTGVALMVAAVAGTALHPGGLASAAPLPSATAITPAQAVDTTMTTITLTVTPGSPADPTTPTLTATVTPSTATGTVQFSSDSFTLGDPVPITDGTASTTIPQAAGEHFMVADFTPTNTGYSGSISNTVSYTTPSASTPATEATPTTITLQATPAVPADASTGPTLTATITPPAATGTVQFTSDGTTLGDPVPVTEGTASTTTPVPTGDHSLIAEFTPTDSAYSGSISNTVSYATTSTDTPAPGAMITTVTLQVTPAVPTDASTAPTLTATITPPAATGTVQFTSDGTTLGDPVPVTEGTASTTTPVPTGDHSLIAEFTPTDSTALSTSTSNTVHYTANSTPTSEGIPATH